MSLSSEDARIQYTVTTSPQSFSVPFYILNSSDITVVATSTSNVDTTLTLNSDYTVTGAGTNPSTAQVVGITGRTGQTLTIYRNAPLTQPSTYTPNDRFPATTQEQNMDRLTMLVQQLRLLLRRAVRFPVTNAEPAELTIPTRKNKLLGFDNTGAISLQDPVGASLITGTLVEVTSYSALRAVSVAALLTGRQAYVGGYSSSGDGGGGHFVYVSTDSRTDNNGTILAPNSGSGRWLRVYSGALDVRWFGAKGDGSTADHVAIQAAIDALNDGDYQGEVIIPTGAYVVEESLTLGAGGLGLSKPVIIRGNGQATQIINRCSAGKPTFSFKGVSYFVVRDMLLTGNSTHPNDGLLIDKDGSGNQSSRFLIENVICQMAGKGFVLKSTNTGVLRSCKSWPSSNSSALTVSQSVNNSDKSHGVYMTGDFCNDVTIYDFDCVVAGTWASTACSLICDAVDANAIRVIGGVIEGSSPGANQYSINFANITKFVIEGVYAENSKFKLDSCRYGNLIGVDKAAVGGTVMTNCRYCTYIGSQDDTISLDSACEDCVIMNVNFDAASSQITDSGVRTRFIHVYAGGVLVPDRGAMPIIVEASLSAPQAMTAGSATVVIAGTETTDTAGAYNPATGRFTPPRAGYFRCSLNGYLDNVANDKEHQVRLLKNGSLHKRVIFTSPSVTAGINFTCNFVSAAGDYWELAIVNGDTVNRNFVLGYLDIEAIS